MQFIIVILRLFIGQKSKVLGKKIHAKSKVRMHGNKYRLIIRINFPNILWYSVLIINFATDI